VTVGRNFQHHSDKTSRYSALSTTLLVDKSYAWTKCLFNV